MASTSMRTRIVSSSKDSLTKFRLQMPAAGDPRVVVNLAGVGKALIQMRTAAGKGPGGKPFKPYSTKPIYMPVDNRKPGYKKPAGGRPSKSGKTVFYAGGYAEYKGAGGFGTAPQLSVSNQMLGAIQIGVMGPNHAFLFFANREAAAKAHGHEFGTVVPQRSFFDLSDFESEAAMKRSAAGYLREAAKRAKLLLI